MIHIKDVAKQTNITVRTLRYYDQIGLLTASAKTEGGHRLYSKDEIEKLQFIQFFKRMGYKLQDIKLILSNSHWDWMQSKKSISFYCGRTTTVAKYGNRYKRINQWNSS
ncbi:MerR family transcriptional regulator [Paenibacillus yanchengensis]|uniref:MerR family transcriptional regulator n=1 Tax=Paenibacillus yanchengensis TaxID=2035833 RepID=A0ABW4YG39_9BACL